MADQSVVGSIKQASTWSVIWGVVLVLFGMLAIGSPAIAGIAVTAVVSWLIIFAGVVHIVLAFSAHGAGSVIWKLLVGLAYVVFGGYLIMHPPGVGVAHSGFGVFVPGGRRPGHHSVRENALDARIGLDTG